jgi:hypothetical protein
VVRRKIKLNQIKGFVTEAGEVQNWKGGINKELA